MIRPLMDRLIVQQEAPQATTEGGLHIPETAQKRNLYAKVLAVGPKCNGVHAGDRIMYHRDAGWDLYLEDRGGDERVMMIEEKDVVGVCE